MLGQDITTTGSFSASTMFLWFVIFYLLSVIPYFGIFQKAGRPTWAAFVPIYNVIVLIEIAGKPGWWILLFLIPIVNFVVLILVLHSLSLNFGHGAGFTLGLIFLGWIFLMILAFGSSRYQGAGGAAAVPPPPAG